MKRQITILVLAWSGFIAVWTFANPPNQTISSDSSKNIGIATSTPMTVLDVNGTTTIRKSLDMTANHIINIASPITGTDAVPMNYITGKIVAVSSSTTRLWGEGRPGSTVINSSGQCTSTISISSRTIKISKSKYSATWDKAAAACPANWWVCTAIERDKNGITTSGFGACPASGATISQVVYCNAPSQTNRALYDNLFVPLQDVGHDLVWVSDAGAPHIGTAVSTAGVYSSNYLCTVAPVWCCSY